MDYLLQNLLNLEQVYLGTENSEYEWKPEYNPNRDYTKGWLYEKDGEIHWTKGQQGHFIYQQLMNIVEQHIDNWVWEYVANKLEGGK